MSIADETDQLVGYFQCLLPVVRLGNPQIVHIHAQLGGIKTVESVLRIDKRGYPAGFLRLGNGMDGQGRFYRNSPDRKSL